MQCIAHVSSTCGVHLRLTYDDGHMCFHAVASLLMSGMQLGLMQDDCCRHTVEGYFLNTGISAAAGGMGKVASIGAKGLVSSTASGLQRSAAGVASSMTVSSLHKGPVNIITKNKY